MSRKPQLRKFPSLKSKRKKPIYLTIEPNSKYLSFSYPQNTYQTKTKILLRNQVESKIIFKVIENSID